MCVFLSRKAPSANLDIRRNSEEDSTYLIPATSWIMGPTVIQELYVNWYPSFSL